MATQSLHLFFSFHILNYPICNDFGTKSCFSGLTIYTNEFTGDFWKEKTVRKGKKNYYRSMQEEEEEERGGIWIIYMLHVLLTVKYSVLFCFLPLEGYLIKFMTEDANQPHI